MTAAGQVAQPFIVQPAIRRQAQKEHRGGMTHHVVHVSHTARRSEEEHQCMGRHVVVRGGVFLHVLVAFASIAACLQLAHGVKTPVGIDIKGSKDAVVQSAHGRVKTPVGIDIKGSKDAVAKKPGVVGTVVKGTVVPRPGPDWEGWKYKWRDDR
jgi:hypothetical protein